MLLAEKNIFVCRDDLSEGLCFVLGFFSTVKKPPKKGVLVVITRLKSTTHHSPITQSDSSPLHRRGC